MTTQNQTQEVGNTMTTQNQTQEVGNTMTTNTTPSSTIDVQAIVQQVKKDVSVLWRFPKECLEIPEIEAMLDNAEFMISQCRWSKRDNLRLASQRLLHDAEFLFATLDMREKAAHSHVPMCMQETILQETLRREIDALLKSEKWKNAFRDYSWKDALSAETLARVVEKDVSILQWVARGYQTAPEIQALTDDATFMLDQVKKDTENLRFASPRLRSRIDFIWACLNATKGESNKSHIVSWASLDVKKIIPFLMTTQNTGK